MSRVVCCSDEFDPSGACYEGVGEFLAMCRACFGEAPELREDADGYWYEGECLILAPLTPDDDAWPHDEGAA